MKKERISRLEAVCIYSEIKAYSNLYYSMSTYTFKVYSESQLSLSEMLGCVNFLFGDTSNKYIFRHSAEDHCESSLVLNQK